MTEVPTACPRATHNLLDDADRIQLKNRVNPRFLIESNRRNAAN